MPVQEKKLLPDAVNKLISSILVSTVNLTQSTQEDVTHFFEPHEYLFIPDTNPKAFILDLKVIAEGLEYTFSDRKGTALSRVSGTGTSYRSVAERPRFKPALRDGYLYFIYYSTFSDTMKDGKVSLLTKYHLIAETEDPNKPLDLEISIQKFEDRTLISPKRDLNIDPAPKTIGNFNNIIKEVLYLLTNKAGFVLLPNEEYDKTYNEYYSERESMFKKNSPTLLRAGGFDKIIS